MKCKLYLLNWLRNQGGSSPAPTPSDTLKLTNGMAMAYWITTPEKVDTSEMTSMFRFFYYYGDSSGGNVTNYPKIDSSNVTDMSYMFYRQQDIGGKLINDTHKFIENFDTSKVTDMSYMFAYTKTNTADKHTAFMDFVKNLDYSKVTNMAHMFDHYDGASAFPQIDTSHVTNMQGMFSSTKFYSMTTFYYDTSSCINMTDIFSTPNFLNISGNNSLKNVLNMCIHCDNTNYEGTKTLYALGFRSNKITASNFESLENYQDFLDAGWTIGY